MRNRVAGVLALSLALAACAPKTGIEPITLDADSEWLNDPAPEPGPAAPAQPVICGEVRLSPDIAAAQPTGAWNGAWILLYARSGSAEGPIVAGIKSKLPPAFPIRFCLSQKNVIVPGAKFAGALWLSARIDADGSAELDPGDYDGTMRASVPVGTRTAVVVIDTFR